MRMNNTCEKISIIISVCMITLWSALFVIFATKTESKRKEIILEDQL